MSPVRDHAPTVDVVVPVHDEELILESSIRRLTGHLDDAFPYPWTITIVDNASTDSTPEVVARVCASETRIRGIRLEEKGKGRAVRTAWLASDADVVAYTDVDLSTGLTGLLPLIAPLVSGHSDVSVGSRLSAESVVVRGPKRELISRAYNLLLRLVFAVRFRDAQCGFKAMRSDVAQRLLPEVDDDAWFFDTELLLLAEHNGLRVHEVPVDWVDDPDSRVDVGVTAKEDLRGIGRMAMRFLRGDADVDLGDLQRQPLGHDLGRQTVTFGVIGVVSTLISLGIFLVLRDGIGAVAANVVAVTATAVGNNWANRRWTFRRRSDQDRRWRWASTLAVYLLTIVGTSLAIASVAGDRVAELVALLVSWFLAGVLRFLLLRRWIYR